MARKRQIDPVYPFEKEIAALSIPARYFYILSWCQADDQNGVMPYEPFFLKSQVFPDDKVDIEKIIQELINQKRLYPFEAEGKNWLWCPNLLKHQMIQHPSKRKYPNPTKEIQEQYRKDTKVIIEPSMSAQCALTQSRVELSRIESNRVELSHKSKNDLILSLMTGLDLTTKQQSAVLSAWCPGLKARTRCYDCSKCEAEFKAIIAKVKKAAPKNFGTYFIKAVNNTITGN